MSGEWGGLILQVVVTIAVVLGLIAGLYWVARRYSAGALGRLGRGRVPRLAVVDAAAVDGRRQLVLVRRDNVEHLILIGGPSDVIVEQGIQRRRRQPGEQPGAAVDGAGTPASSSETPPIPFPQAARAAAAGPQIFAAPTRRVASAQSLFAAPRHEEPESSRMEAASEPVATAMAFPAAAEAMAGRSSYGAASAAPSAIPTPFAPPSRAFDQHAQSAEAAAMMERPSPASEAASDETASKVNDLEREMARLLGEITAGKRP